MKELAITVSITDRRKLRAELKYIRAKIRATHAAVHAYMTCEVLDDKTRKRLARLTEACRMTAKKAIRVVIAFAQGYLEDIYDWDVVQAWLRLGDEVFRRAYRTVKPELSAAWGPKMKPVTIRGDAYGAAPWIKLRLQP